MYACSVFSSFISFTLPNSPSEWVLLPSSFYKREKCCPERMSNLREVTRLITSCAEVETKQPQSHSRSKGVHRLLLQQRWCWITAQEMSSNVLGESCTVMEKEIFRVESQGLEQLKSFLGEQKRFSEGKELWDQWMYAGTIAGS